MEKFSKEKIDEIAKVVGAEKIEWDTDHYRLKISSKESRRLLVLEIYPSTALGRQTGAMIVVYAGGAHLQLHNCSGFVCSEEFCSIIRGPLTWSRPTACTCGLTSSTLSLGMASTPSQSLRMSDGT